MNDVADMTDLKIGEVQWHIRVGWEAALLDAGGLPLARWLATGRAREVKSHDRRAVYAVEHAGRSFFLKHDRNVGFLRALGYAIRGGSARREWQATTETLRRGVRTALPVAWGERVRGGLVRESYLITEAIPLAVPLDRFILDNVAQLAPDRRADVRRRIVQRLAEFVAGIHRAGVRHNDFHSGNMLVRAEAVDGDSPLDIYLIDMQGARFSGPLDWPASRENLVVLNAKWFDQASIAERWRFWRAYLRLRPELSVPERKTVIEELDLGSREHSRRVCRRRDRRAMANNRDFKRARSDAGVVHAVRDLPDSVRDAILKNPERLLRDSMDRPLKIGPISLIVRGVLPLDGGPVEIVYKRARPRNWWKALCDRFRRGRAARAWYLGHALLARGIRTARPLLACEPRRPRFWRESYLATQWIEGAEDLHRWGRRMAAQPEPQRLRLAARCAENLGRLLGRMHAQQVSHRDLKGNNVLIAGGDDEMCPWLIDLDGVRIHRRISASRRASDLARLATSVEAHPWITRSIRYRFLRVYAAQFPRNVIECRSLWRSIAARTRRLMRRKLREGKPLW